MPVKRKPRPKKPDPAANMFAISITKEGVETGIARVDTIAEIRSEILRNMAIGQFTEVVILNIRQLDVVVKRLLDH